MRRSGLAAAALGVGMMAEALTGCGGTGESATQPPATEHIAPETSSIEEQIAANREAAMRAVDIEIQCAIGSAESGDGIDVRDRKKFTGDPEIVRFGLPVDDTMLAIDVVFNPTTDAISVEPLGYDFASSGQPQSLAGRSFRGVEGWSNPATTISNLIEEPELEELPRFYGDDGSEYALYVTANRPDGTPPEAAVVDVYCVKLPA